MACQCMASTWGRRCASCVPSLATPCVHRRQSRAAPERRGRWRHLFSVRWRINTFVACTFFTCLVIPYFAIGTFVTQVMGALNLKGGFAGGLIYNLAIFGGSIAGLLVVDRISRRSFLVGSFLTAAVTMFILSAWPQIGPGPVVTLFAIFACVLSAASSLVFVYIPELFPTGLRASGIGLAVAASRIGSAISTFILPEIVAVFGVRTALGACVAVLSIGVLVCLRWAPETRQLGLEALDHTAMLAEAPP